MTFPSSAIRVRSSKTFAFPAGERRHIPIIESPAGALQISSESVSTSSSSQRPDRKETSARVAPTPGRGVVAEAGGSLDGKSIVRPRESLEYTRRMAEVGIFSGISAGAALAGAVKVASRIESGVIVFIVSDYGWKYLSTGAWTLDLDEAAANAEKVIYF